MSKQRTAVTVSYRSVNPANLVIAEDPFTTDKGGKLVTVKYRHDGRVYDRLRIQTPELGLGKVFPNVDEKSGLLKSYTVALNLDRILPADVETLPSGEEDEIKAAQRTFIEALDSIDQALIDRATERAWFVGPKGAKLSRESVEGKYTNTVHWPKPDTKYTLGVRFKIDMNDVAEKCMGIVDQHGRDITFFKLDPDTGARVYTYDERFTGLATEAVFNIDALAMRARVQRMIVECNNAWIQANLSCPYKIVRMQVETADESFSSVDWVDDAPAPATKKSRLSDAAPAPEAAAEAAAEA